MMMKWERATFVDLRMDAEIGSYQDDSEREGPAFVAREQKQPPTRPRATRRIPAATLPL